MKKSISILTALLLVVQLVAATVIPVQADTLGNLTYVIEEGQAIITDCNSEVKGRMVLPSTIRGFEVTAIEDDAFRDCDGLTEIVLPDTVTSIGSYAFYHCTGLTAVTLPQNLIRIGSHAFNGCAGLTNVVIPEGTTTVEHSAFTYCTGLTGISLPDSLEFLGSSVFSGCTGLREARIPDGITAIESSLFWGCSSLTDVTLGSGVQSIEWGGFEDCTGLKEILIPGNVKTVGRDAFAGCTSLEQVTLCEGVDYIALFAFDGCTSLTGINIPASVTDIDTSAFTNCTALTGYYVSEDSLSYSSDDRGVLFDRDKTWLCAAPLTISGSYDIPDSVTAIASHVFWKCAGLTAVTIPESVTVIHSGAFYDCTGLTHVTFPEGLESIGEYAFSGCSSLNNVTFPTTLTTLGGDAFLGCDSITEVTIPKQITQVGYRAFLRCSGLTKFTVDPENPNYSSDDRGVLFDKNKTILIQAPETINGSYRVPDSVTEIHTAAFSSCVNLTDVIVPASVTEVYHGTFSKCSGLEALVFCGDSPDFSDASMGDEDDPLAFDLIYHTGTQGWDRTIQLVDYSPNINWVEAEHIVLEYHSNNDATCTQDGTKSGTCVVCGETETVTDEGSGGHRYEGGVCVSCGQRDPDSTLSIRVDLKTSGTGETELKLYAQGSDQPCLEWKSSDGALTLELLIQGVYELHLSKENHVTRVYPLDLTGELPELDLELHLTGDITGDGKVNVVDTAKVYACAKRTSQLTDYDLLCADVNGDGKVNTLDVAKIYAHARMTTPLW